MDNKQFKKKHLLLTIHGIQPRNIKLITLTKKTKEWIDMIETNGVFLTDSILTTKALSIFDIIENMEKSKFKASNSWLNKFKIGHNISSKEYCGESFELIKEYFFVVFF
ncbi:hypothetical protein NGRA_2878 [Nosema granulosis]|uniref:HTH CENPB-type domain-containing protein n=1 Tax=Nosema granulosis TaxID=83296 RepID=A0A9P6KXA6_9MICR|nr:hypothetical protein NGRA_2878 [Nosema granulosis]